MSSDTPSNFKSELFEILPGLPSVGPVPEQFTASGSGTHSEGLVICFHPRQSQSWVGNFVSGFNGMTNAYLHPDQRTVIVVSGGQAYQVDPESRTLHRHFGGGITNVVVDPKRGLLIFADDIHLWALDPRGQRWETERLSWDGTRDLRIQGEFVVGEAYDPMTDRWRGFSVCLETGTIKGGSYGFRLW